MVLRKLDGIYFRIERDGEWVNVCLSDMTEEEMDKVLAKLDKKSLLRTCKIMAQTLRNIGEQLDLWGE